MSNQICQTRSAYLTIPQFSYVLQRLTNLIRWTVVSPCLSSFGHRFKQWIPLHGHQLFLSPTNLLALVQFSPPVSCRIHSFPSLSFLLQQQMDQFCQGENGSSSTADCATEWVQPGCSDVTTVTGVNIINQGHLDGEQWILNLRHIMVNF